MLSTHKCIDSLICAWFLCKFKYLIINFIPFRQVASGNTRVLHHVYCCHTQWTREYNKWMRGNDEGKKSVYAENLSFHVVKAQVCVSYMVV